MNSIVHNLNYLGFAPRGTCREPGKTLEKIVEKIEEMKQMKMKTTGKFGNSGDFHPSFYPEWQSDSRASLPSQPMCSYQRRGRTCQTRVQVKWIAG